MPMNIVGTVGAISLAAFLFVLPLVVKYHVYRPSVRAVMEGDVVLLERPVSPTWCQGVRLTSDTQFETYVYRDPPSVDETEHTRTLYTHQMVLPNKAQEYWGFHFLRGSRLDLSTCARLIGGGVTVVRGQSGLNQCLEEHRRSAEEADASGEDSLSASESDEDTSSISSSQGAIMNDTETVYVCKNSLHHILLPPSYRCSQLHQEFRTKHTLSLEIGETDYYYFIFSSRTYLEIIPNEFFVQFTIDRTHYDYVSSSSNCSISFDCNVNVSIGHSPVLVVQTAGINGSLQSKDLHFACKPREWIFFMFYAAFLLVIFICAFQ